uniref:Uncharacterized protein n=1 Tax=Oryza brachyantha TaxID=4533 RepID=J3LA40_ORYBR
VAVLHLLRDPCSCSSGLGKKRGVWSREGAVRLVLTLGIIVGKKRRTLRYYSVDIV